MIAIRPALPSDGDALWRILEPIVRGGEVFAWPRDMSREAALALWAPDTAEVFVAEADGVAVGTAYMKPNQLDGGAHVANAGFGVLATHEGRGIARALCEHTLGRARDRGYFAMQFNFVVSTNVRAIRLWTSLGFATAGVLPGAFQHPRLGMVDAYVMHRQL